MTVRSSIAHHTIPTRLVGKDVVLNATCVVGLVINNNDRLRSVIGHIRLEQLEWRHLGLASSVNVKKVINISLKRAKNCLLKQIIIQ